MSMDLRALRYFIAAVSEGSISSAALKCHVAQPSITLAIGKLEDQFNCKLLLRHRKGVSLTDKGAQLYKMALDLIQHADSLESEFIANTSAIALTVFIDHNVQVSYLHSLIAAAHTQGLTVQFEVVNQVDNADLQLTHQGAKQGHGVFHPLMRERYALLVPCSHHLAHKPSLTLADLDGQNLIERSQCENRPLFERFMSQLEFSMPVVAQVDNEEQAISLAACGLGFCISPVSEEFSDPRFKVLFLDSLLGLDLPERQVGVFYKNDLNQTKLECIMALLKAPTMRMDG